MGRIKVGVDIDGVLADFVGKARQELQLLLKGKPADDLVQTEWGFDSIGITKEEEGKLWRFIDATPNWWLGLERRPDCHYLRHLCDHARVIFITNRKDGTGLPIEDQSRKWLERHFHIPHPTVLISDNKGPLADGLKLDWLIDDRPKNVEEVAQFSPATKTFLLDATYNKKCHAVPRIGSVDEFIVRCLPCEAFNELPNLNYGRCVA
jgi:5'(3')-deoxyribonucleotidase